MQEAQGLARLKQCPRCHQMFGCQASGRGCWCTHLWVPVAVLAALQQDYTDCLCKNCLIEMVERYRHARAGLAETSP
ncbi:MAG: cysteine-rich CWC family protein [Phycisphaerales bacterium]|nr:cysteine-rich CWC family protein [Phycisphaerales bacterium]